MFRLVYNALLLFVDGPYKNSEKGKDCPLGTIIDTESECKLAASNMTLTFKRTVRFSLRQAGCYFLPHEQQAYFNENIDPRLTSPVSYAVGLCKGIAAHNILHITLRFILTL